MIRGIYAVCFKNLLFSEGIFPTSTDSYAHTSGAQTDICYLFRYSDRGRKRFRTQFSMAFWRHLAEANSITDKPKWLTLLT
jgi:hypothetical protein